MKKINIFNSIAGILAITLATTACADIEYPEHSKASALQQIYMSVSVPQVDKSKVVYESVYGVIDENNHKVTFEVPYNMSEVLDDVTDLTHTFLVASVPVSSVITPGLGGVHDMTNPLNITVTAADGSKSYYTLEAKLKKSDKASITSFSFTIGDNVFTGVPDEATHKVTYFVATPELADLIAKNPVIPNIEVSPRATILNDLSQPIDFSKDVVIKVQAQDGTVVDWTIAQSEPQILDYGFGYTRKKYVLSSDALGITGDLNIRSMTVTNNYLVMHDRYFKFKLYDKETGNYVGEAGYPADLSDTNKANSMYIDKDAAGKLVAGSFTSWTTGSNFVLYYYHDGETVAPKRILQVAGLGDCGRKFTVCGNLTSGTAFVYATKGKGNLVYRFRFIDGEYKDMATITIKEPNAAFTYMCTPIALSNTADSEFILVDQQATGVGSVSKHKADGTMVAQMADDAKCQSGGITADGKVFTFNGATYLMYIDANSNSTLGCLRIYDITSADNFSMGASHPNFGKFLVFKSDDMSSTTNGNGTAAVAYDIAPDGQTCDVYMMLTSGGVMKYQLTKIAL
ncbi:MAG: DUF5018 domain-containing protein [Bacteroidales bacterium]|nr:DUF5018 domain-containing protein [Candidatus Sodaliphilus fimicaballi]